MVLLNWFWRVKHMLWAHVSLCCVLTFYNSKTSEKFPQNPPTHPPKPTNPPTKTHHPTHQIHHPTHQNPPSHPPKPTNTPTKTVQMTFCVVGWRWMLPLSNKLINVTNVKPLTSKWCIIFNFEQKVSSILYNFPF